LKSWMKIWGKWSARKNSDTLTAGIGGHIACFNEVRSD
jgi:hypothetical protein